MSSIYLFVHAMVGTLRCQMQVNPLLISVIFQEAQLETLRCQMQVNFHPLARAHMLF